MKGLETIQIELQRGDWILMLEYFFYEKIESFIFCFVKPWTMINTENDNNFIHHTLKFEILPILGPM